MYVMMTMTMLIVLKTYGYKNNDFTASFTGVLWILFFQMSCTNDNDELI